MCLLCDFRIFLILLSGIRWSPVRSLLCTGVVACLMIGIVYILMLMPWWLRLIRLLLRCRLIRVRDILLVIPDRRRVRVMALLLSVFVYALL